MFTTFTRTIACLLFAAMAAPASAGWLTGTITDIKIVNDGSNNGVYVGTSFSTGCSYNGFLMVSTDPYFDHIYAQIVTAKATGRQITIYTVYCHASGYARASVFQFL